jgi:hypothetical protein
LFKNRIQSILANTPDCIEHRSWIAENVESGHLHAKYLKHGMKEEHLPMRKQTEGRPVTPLGTVVLTFPDHQETKSESGGKAKCKSELNERGSKNEKGVGSAHEAEKGGSGSDVQRKGEEKQQAATLSSENEHQIQHHVGKPFGESDACAETISLQRMTQEREEGVGGCGESASEADQFSAKKKELGEGEEPEGNRKSELDRERIRLLEVKRDFFARHYRYCNTRNIEYVTLRLSR